MLDKISILVKINFSDLENTQKVKSGLRSLAYAIAAQRFRTIPGLIEASVFKNRAICKTWRMVEREFMLGNYGFLMADMLIDVAKDAFDAKDLQLWIGDLELKNNTGHYYFAIDLNVAVVE